MNILGPRRHHHCCPGCGGVAREMCGCLHPTALVCCSVCYEFFTSKKCMQPDRRFTAYDQAFARSLGISLD